MRGMTNHCLNDKTLVMEGLIIEDKTEISQEEKEKFASMKTNMNAKAKFIEENMGLVRKVAMKYKNFGVEYEDLVQEGSIGLMHAIDKYDVNKGSRFSTYAMYWIRQTVVMAINDKSRMVRIPRNLSSDVASYMKNKGILENENLKKLSAKQVSEYLNISEEKAKMLESVTVKVVSLEEPFKKSTSDDPFVIQDTIASDSEFEDEVVNKSLKTQIFKLFEMCNFSEETIKMLVLRYGIDGLGTRTYEEIGRALGKKPNAVAQAEKRALNKMRKCEYIYGFADCMDDAENAKIRLRELVKKK